VYGRPYARADRRAGPEGELAGVRFIEAREIGPAVVPGSRSRVTRLVGRFS
jgi:hypothetical protein